MMFSELAGFSCVTLARRVPPVRDVTPARRVPPAHDVTLARSVFLAHDVTLARSVFLAHDVPPPRRVPPDHDVTPARRLPPAQDVTLARSVRPAHDVTPARRVSLCAIVLYFPVVINCYIIHASPINHYSFTPQSYTIMRMFSKYPTLQNCCAQLTDEKQVGKLLEISI